MATKKNTHGVSLKLLQITTRDDGTVILEVETAAGVKAFRVARTANYSTVRTMPGLIAAGNDHTVTALEIIGASSARRGLSPARVRRGRSADRCLPLKPEPLKRSHEP